MAVINQKNDDIDIIIKGDNFNANMTPEQYDAILKANNGNIFAIPCNYMPQLYEQLKPLIKKANKYNIPYCIEELGKITKYSNITEKYYTCIVIKINFEIKLGDWRFIASIDHLEKGNIIKSIFDTDLPEKYRTAKETTCDHCNTKRYRKNTFVVYNEKTKEFKQVGRNCLKLYTGIDVSKVTAVYDFYNIIENATNYEDGGAYDPDFCGGCYFVSKYINVIETLIFASEAVRVFGYQKSKSKDSTVGHVIDIENFFNGTMQRYYPKEYIKFSKFLKDNNFDFYSENIKKKAETIRDYILSLKVDNDYMNNMHVLMSEDDVQKRYRAFIVSAVQVYNKAIEQETNYKKQHENELTSEHVGNVGDRITLNIKSYKVVTSWESEYGVIFIYKFIDNNENILIWKTSKNLNNNYLTITGTIKNHNDYKGIKQTELTRCNLA